MRNRFPLPDLLAAYAAGLGVAAFAGEIYAHRQSHRTMRLKTVPRIVAQTLFWSVGSDPITAGVEHRIHHAAETAATQCSLPLAVKKVIGQSFVSRRRIEDKILRADIRSGALPPGTDLETDPLLKYDTRGNAVALKYEDPPGTWLTRLPASTGNVVVPSVLFGLAVLLARQRHPRRDSLGVGVALCLSYLAGFGTPVVLSGIPENMIGGNGIDRGIDVRIPAIALFIPTSSLMHRSHHQHPDLADPPGAPRHSIDRHLTGIAAKLRLIERTKPGGQVPEP